MKSNHPLFGIALVISAVACFAALDTSVRFVGAFFPIALVLWVRYGLHTVIMTVYIFVTNKHAFRTERPMFQIARGALLAFASAMSFAALQRMPVAEFTSIILLAPVFVTVFARIWLKAQGKGLSTKVGSGRGQFHRGADCHTPLEWHRGLGCCIAIDRCDFERDISDHDQPLRPS